MEIVQKIGRIKQSSHASILDKKRWQQVLEGIDAKAKKLKLPKKFVHELFTRIHQQALETERKDL
jgi:chorismate mutase